MATRVQGYNVAFTVGNKKFAGTTDDDFSISPTVKESKTKADAGTTKKTVSGYDFAFSVSGICEILETGDEATMLGRDEIIGLTIAGDPVAFVYSMPGARGYSGSAIISGYTEKSGSEDEATYTLNFSSNSILTPIPVA